MTLLNGKDAQSDCSGSKISIAIWEKGGEVCYSQEEPEILADSTFIWNTQDLGKKCRGTLFDPDKGMEVQVRTKATRDPFCPKKVELEILDLNSNQPRYFCSTVEDRSGGYVDDSNWIRHPAKEERCFST